MFFSVLARSELLSNFIRRFFPFFRGRMMRTVFIYLFESSRTTVILTNVIPGVVYVCGWLR